LCDVAHTIVATTRAIELANAHDASLTGVTLFDADGLDPIEAMPIGAGTYAMELGEARRQEVREVIAHATAHFEVACDKAGVPFKVVEETGDPLTSLIYHSRYHDLMITGVRGLFEHGVIDEPTDELAHLVQEGVRPIVVVAKEDRPINSVLIAYSGSMQSAKTMRRFVQLRLWPKAKLRIVTFCKDAALGVERLEHAAEYCQAHGYDPQVECVESPSLGQLLPYAAKHNSDLIVLGNSARNMLLRKILGETALDVMRHTDRPLFLAQ
jgi:nucleotide-binding universal stress UspA family protein